MKLLADEMPYYKDDCMFVDLRWNNINGFWVSYCKFTNDECDLDINEQECSFLKGADRKTEPHIDIVRCAECKHKQKCHKAVEHITHEPTSVTIGYKSVDFCSYGEREGE